MSSPAEVVLSPGETLYREGDATDCGYIVESGELAIHKNQPGRDPERAGAGSVIGELSILTGRNRAATVKAVTACRLYRISTEQIIDRFRNLDPILRACIEASASLSSPANPQAYADSGQIPLATGVLTKAADLVERFRFETDIVNGLERQEFTLVYQPIVRLADNSIAGVEALMRWSHPDKGNIPPYRFIEAAESMGAIGKLTEFAISEACAAQTRLRDAGLVPDSFYISVNISGKDIIRPGFVDFVAHALDRHDLPASALKLELTETSLVVDPAAAATNLSQLRRLGCGISIDDFGTGYSNLAYLKTLPLTVLKIDRAFAGDAHENPVSRSIVRMLIELSEDLGVDVVAEGLETREDVDTLLELGCAFAQGYYFCKPASEANITAILSTEKSQMRCAV